jgi:hypothetical protein
LVPFLSLSSFLLYANMCTQMAPEILHRVLFGTSNLSSHPTLHAAASKLTITSAILHDYCRHKVLYADYPGIVPQQGASVRGTFVTGLTDENVRSLDWFEGTEYERVKVAVVLLRDGEDRDVEGSEVKEAETYVFTAGDGSLEKEEWDYEVFRREKLGRWADRSEEYAGESFGSAAML